MKDILAVVTNIEHCIEQLRSACAELSEFGVTYHTIDIYKSTISLPPTIYLSRGITEISTSFGKEIESSPTESNGRLYIGDIKFVQPKLPVERQDRYA